MRPLLALSNAIDLLNEKIGYVCNLLVLLACLVSAANARDVKLEITPDRQKVKVTGQLVRPTGLLNVPLKTAPQAVIQVALKQEQQSAPVTR